jgi:hypothetical protein
LWRPRKSQRAARGTNLFHLQSAILQTQKPTINPASNEDKQHVTTFSLLGFDFSPLEASISSPRKIQDNLINVSWLAARGQFLSLDFWKVETWKLESAKVV